MIDPSIIQGLRQVADQLDGSSTATWLRRVADELEQCCKNETANNNTTLQESNTHDVTKKLHWFNSLGI